MNALKTLVAGIALALSAGVANAAIDDGNPGNQLNDAGDIHGELFLNVWNQAAGETFTFDTGWSYDAFVANPTSFTANFGSDANWANFAATGNPLVFSLGAMNSVGLGTTGARNYYVLSVDTLNPNFGSDATSTAVRGYMGLRIQDINQADLDVNLNNSTFSVSGEPGDYPNYWGSNVGSTHGSIDTDTEVGQWLAMYEVWTTGARATTKLNNRLLGYAFLDKDEGTLSFASQPPSTVPVPPAFWLMGSAMTALVGFSRRRHA
ncbi:hypothetical protein sS8_0350 [Methylocaldum marinum]|uniref:PEP-CTERM protein-sorting domain-containing protein n=1 Tax=Methylocaldum marinum TaxID=1432792 RepID=A0A286P3U6_9GAMM|nr:hypothetical protein [Methylocaldum marinum]BBA32318.1 hypothetical protein sS8_0350 [Methylocaldum marinum]